MKKGYRNLLHKAQKAFSDLRIELAHCEEVMTLSDYATRQKARMKLICEQILEVMPLRKETLSFNLTFRHHSPSIAAMNTSFSFLKSLLVYIRRKAVSCLYDMSHEMSGNVRHFFLFFFTRNLVNNFLFCTVYGNQQ